MHSKWTLSTFLVYRIVFFDSERVVQVLVEGKLLSMYFVDEVHKTVSKTAKLNEMLAIGHKHITMYSD